MQSIIGDMVKALKSNFLLLLLFSALLTALSLLLPSKTNNLGSSLVTSSILIYFLHRQVLFGLHIKAFGKSVPPQGVVVPKDSTGRFILVSVFFTLIVAVPAGFVAYKWATLQQGQFAKDQFTGMLLIIGVVLLWIALSAIGTALPAAASRLPFSISRAWQAGRKIGLRVALQLVLFPGLTWLALLAFALFCGWAIGPRLQTPPISYAAEIFFGALFMIPSVMTVVILVRAFKTAYPVE